MSNYIVKILKTFISPEEVRQAEQVIVQNREARSMISNLGIVLKKEYEEKFLKGLEEGRDKGLEQGLVKGIEEGKREGMAAVIRRMHSNEFTVEQIVSAAGFTTEEVKNMLI